MPRTPKAFKEMVTSHIECRTWQHAWDHNETFLIGSLLEIHLVCLRCEAGRIDTHTRSGERIKRRYQHPPEYLVEDKEAWGGRRVFNDNVRGELMNRLVKDAKRKE